MLEMYHKLANDQTKTCSYAIPGGPVRLIKWDSTATFETLRNVLRADYNASGLYDLCSAQRTRLLYQNGESAFEVRVADVIDSTLGIPGSLDVIARHKDTNFKNRAIVRQNTRQWSNGMTMAFQAVYPSSNLGWRIRFLQNSAYFIFLTECSKPIFSNFKKSAEGILIV